jgi:hypothetical protein
MRKLPLYALFKALTEDRGMLSVDYPYGSSKQQGDRKTTSFGLPARHARRLEQRLGIGHREGRSIDVEDVMPPRETPLSQEATL